MLNEESSSLSLSSSDSGDITSSSDEDVNHNVKLEPTKKLKNTSTNVGRTLSTSTTPLVPMALGTKQRDRRSIEEIQKNIRAKKGGDGKSRSSSPADLLLTSKIPLKNESLSPTLMTTNIEDVSQPNKKSTVTTGVRASIVKKLKGRKNTKITNLPKSSPSINDGTEKSIKRKKNDSSESLDK